MTNMAVLVAAGTALTNPNPNTGLTTVDPFGTNGGLYTPQQAWIDQAKMCIAMRQPTTAHLFLPSCRLDFQPSAGAAATYTVTMWHLNKITRTWYIPKDNNTFTLTGNQFTYLENPDTDPWFPQLSNISSGTVQIMYDGGLMRSF